MEFLTGMGKVAALSMAVLSAAGSVGEFAAQTETQFLNVPLSVLYVSIGGALIGVFLLPNKDAARIGPAPAGNLGRRILYIMANAGALGAAVLCYAFLAAWSVQVVALLLNVRAEVVLPATGILGAFIRPLLPAYLRGAEAMTSRILGSVKP